VRSGPLELAAAVDAPVYGEREREREREKRGAKFRRWESPQDTVLSVVQPRSFSRMVRKWKRFGGNISAVSQLQECNFETASNWIEIRLKQPLLSRSALKCV
jgi:hypothetical protein